MSESKPWQAAFYGTSENAVKSQIGIAVAAYVLLAIVRKRPQLDALLYTLLQIFSVTLFENTPLHAEFLDGQVPIESGVMRNQLNFSGTEPDSRGVIARIS